MQEKPAQPMNSLNEPYAKMAQDEQRETEALEWAEATVGDASDENA